MNVKNSIYVFLPKYESSYLLLCPEVLIILLNTYTQAYIHIRRELYMDQASQKALMVATC